MSRTLRFYRCIARWSSSVGALSLLALATIETTANAAPVPATGNFEAPLSLPVLIEVAKGTGIVPGNFSKDGAKEPAAGDRVTMLIELEQAKQTRQCGGSRKCLSPFCPAVAKR